MFEWGVLYLDDLSWLHGESGEVSTAMDGNSFSEDRVQAPHLIPRQDAEPAVTLIRRITARHGDEKLSGDKVGVKKSVVNVEPALSSCPVSSSVLKADD